jgi:hypothetical protein
MASKMISEQELHDDFLSAMIRSEEPMKIPAGFKDEVMNSIGELPLAIRVKPYAAPAWLKWGIPGVIFSCFMALLISEPSAEPAELNSGISFIEKSMNGINSWLSGFSIDIQLPDLNISGTLAWILAGGMVLTLSFILMFRFLERKAKQ